MLQIGPSEVLILFSNLTSSFALSDTLKRKVPVSQRVPLCRSKIIRRLSKIVKKKHKTTLVFQVMEYPRLVWIKAARFLGIVVFVKRTQKALPGALVWSPGLLSQNCRKAL